MTLLQGCSSAYAPWRLTPHGIPHPRRPHLLILVSSRLWLRVVLVPETPASWASHVSLSVLAPQGLMHSSGPVGRHRQLILVLEGELYLIPFALLKGSSSNEYLYERFGLLAVPSIRSLSVQSKVRLTHIVGDQGLVLGSRGTVYLVGPGCVTKV